MIKYVDNLDWRNVPFVIQEVFDQRDWHICWVVVGLRLWEAKWRNVPFVIQEVFDQRYWHICWVVVGLHLWEAKWKIDHALLPPRRLSIHVVNCIFLAVYDIHGFCDYTLPGLMSFLQTFGVHLAKRMPWEWCLGMCIDQKEGVLGKIFSYTEDESFWMKSRIEDVLEDLHNHPLAALIYAAHKFINHKSLNVYSHDPGTDFSKGKILLHAALVIGYGFRYEYTGMIMMNFLANSSSQRNYTLSFKIHRGQS